jgi:hypothetical protein
MSYQFYPHLILVYSKNKFDKDYNPSVCVRAKLISFSCLWFQLFFVPQFHSRCVKFFSLLSQRKTKSGGGREKSEMSIITKATLFNRMWQLIKVALTPTSRMYLCVRDWSKYPSFLIINSFITSANLLSVFLFTKSREDINIKDRVF